MSGETSNSSGVGQNGASRMEELAQAHDGFRDETQTKSPVPPRNKGGRPRKDGLPPGSVGKPGTARATPQPQVATSQLFAPEVLGPIFRMPYLFMATKTKSTVWLLEPTEEKVLADSGAATLNAFCPTLDPRWAALTAFSLALIVMTGNKMMMYVGEKREAAKNNKTADPVITPDAGRPN